MDYREVRKRDKIKRKGGDTSGRALRQPKRVDYSKRCGIVVLIVLFVIVVGLGVVILKQNNVSFSILPPPPTAEPLRTDLLKESESSKAADGAEESVAITDKEGNTLPTVEPPNTYSLD